MRSIIFVALGGSLGAVLRFMISSWITMRWPTWFPLGTLVVNGIGSLAMGILLESNIMTHWAPATRLMATTGMLGALTTFSTFSFETLRLLEQYNARLALANVVANVVLCLVAVILGAALGRAM